MRLVYSQVRYQHRTINIKLLPLGWITSSPIYITNFNSWACNGAQVTVAPAPVWSDGSSLIQCYLLIFWVNNLRNKRTCREPFLHNPNNQADAPMLYHKFCIWLILDNQMISLLQVNHPQSSISCAQAGKRCERTIHLHRTRYVE